MRRSTPTFTAAALCALAAVVLNLAAFALGGGAQAPLLIGGAALWFLLGAGLRRGWRWVGYLAYLVGLFGGTAAMALAMDAPSQLQQMVWWGLAAAQWLAALLLFLGLWRDPRRRRARTA